MRTARQYAVRIEIGDHYGSGFCYFPPDGGLFYIITAKHVIYGDEFDQTPQNKDIFIEHIPGLSKNRFALTSQDRIISLEGVEDLSILVVNKESFEGLLDQPPEIQAVDTDFGLVDSAVVGFPFFAGSEEVREILCDFRGVLDETNDTILLESKRPFDTLHEYGPVNAKGLSGAGVYLEFEGKQYLTGVVTEFTQIDSFVGFGITKINKLLKREGLPTIPTTHLVVDPAIKIAIRSFHQNNRAIGAKIRDKIGTVHVPRLNLDSTTQLQAEKKVLIIDGNAGAGKSAFAKAVVGKYLHDHEVILFSGEQLSAATIDLALQHLPVPIATPFEQLLEDPAFKKKKLIWIESVEKLLETSHTEAFSELLGIVDTRQDLKVVLTIRTYTLHLLHLRFAFSLPKATGEHTVSPFTDDELSAVEKVYPTLQSLLAKNRLNALLHIPFYLTYAVQFLHVLANEEDLDEARFREIIWGEAIRKGVDERGVAFEQLSVKRAKEMSLYTQVDARSTVIESLYADNLIYLEDDELKERYCPAHDVLEDWALMRYISRHKRDETTPEQFFKSVGNEPAIRRAFRLWLGEALQNVNTALITFVRDTIGNAQVDSYWKDEVFVSILRSTYSENFFSENGHLLLQNGQYLAHRFINLLKTACKEKNNAKGKRFFPILIGGGWASMVKFLSTNRVHFSNQFIPVLYFLLDWQSKCYNGSEIQSDEGEAAGLLSLHILTWLKTQEDSSNRNIDFSFLTDKALELAFALTEYIQPQMEELLKTAEAGMNRKVPDPDYLSIAYYEKIALKAIEGLHCSQLCRFLPDQVIEMFKRKISVKPVELGKWGHDGRPDEVETHFGLEYNYDYKCFPASIYQTPAFWLFKAHAMKAMKLIVEVVNHCTTSYAKSGESAQYDPVLPVQLTLNDGSRIIQMGNSALWQMYRGSGGPTPHILQSMLMSLEQGLFDLAESGHPDAEAVLHRIYNYLYRKSTSIATTSVLASVALRFPDLVGDMALPLYSSKYTFLWEASRVFDDSDLGIGRGWLEKSVHDEERLVSDALPHRKIPYGLGSLIRYQTGKSPELRDRIFALLDSHCAELKEEDDVRWHKTLTEIDVRTWRPQKGQDEQFYLIPEYQGKAKAFVEEGQAQARKSAPETDQWIWIKAAYAKEDTHNTDIHALKEAISFYRAGKFEERLFRHPGILAIVGLRDYAGNLSEDDKKWCIAEIKNVVQLVIDERFHSAHTFGVAPYSTQDMNACFEFLPHLLFSIDHTAEESLELQRFFCQVLLAPLHEHEMKKVLDSARADLWALNPEFGNKCFCLLIAFGSLIMEKKGWRDAHGRWDNDRRVNDTESLIEEILKGGKSMEVSLTLESFTARYYSRALSIVPAGHDKDNVRQFARMLLELHLETFEEHGGRDDSGNYYQDRATVSALLPEMMLAQPQSFGKSIIDYLYDQYEAESMSKFAYLRRSKKREFIEQLITTVIYALENSITLSEEHFRTSNFWGIWEHLHQRNKATGKKYFSNQLLLNVDWKDTATHWKPLDNKAAFMTELIDSYGVDDLSAVLNFLSTIGDKILMPSGISIVVKLFNQWFAGRTRIYGPKGVKFAQRAFYKHGVEVKGNRTLLNDFLLILDQLSDQGSSEAYFIREDMITFKVQS